MSGRLDFQLFGAFWSQQRESPRQTWGKVNPAAAAGGEERRARAVTTEAMRGHVTTLAQDNVSLGGFGVQPLVRDGIKCSHGTQLARDFPKKTKLLYDALFQSLRRALSDSTLGTDRQPGVLPTSKCNSWQLLSSSPTGPTLANDKTDKFNASIPQTRPSARRVIRIWRSYLRGCGVRQSVPRRRNDAVGFKGSDNG